MFFLPALPSVPPGYSEFPGVFAPGPSEDDQFLMEPVNFEFRKDVHLVITFGMETVCCQTYDIS
jgi:hypothetical protein